MNVYRLKKLCGQHCFRELCVVLSLNMLVMCVMCGRVYIVPLADIPAQPMVLVYKGRLLSSLPIFERPDLFKVRHYLFIVIINLTHLFSLLHYQICFYQNRERLQFVVLMLL